MKGQSVKFPCKGVTTEGYLSLPEGSGGPGVVVIQEWQGLVEHVKSVADRFAAAGFVALAPDLYHGKATESPDEAGKLMMAMSIGRAELDLAGAVSHLRSHPQNSTGKVGTVGFCMGGALSLYAACRNPEVSACVVFYGGHPDIKPDLKSLKCPVLGLYAARDKFVTVASVRALEEQLRNLSKTYEFHIYPNADHAFFNDERPEVYSKEAADDAWDRTLQFLKRHLNWL